MAGSSDLFLVVMAGGSGTRFWPKSTSKRPKQLLAFGQDQRQTLLVQTLKRFEGLLPDSNRLVVTTETLAPAIAEQAPGVMVLAEPQGRNTAPCVYWAARKVAELNPRGVMLVMPSDHYIARPDAFRSTVKTAAGWAMRQDHLVTLGVRPTRPETGYGYLKVGATIDDPCARVDAFVEKPNLEKAEAYVKSGQYLWNGGMFLWKASTILAAFDEFMPELRRAWDAAGGDIQKAYPQMTATSIDFGVMEKAKNVVTFPLDCGWDDLGSWISLEEMASALGGAKRPEGVVTGGESVAVDAKGCIVDAPGKLVALLGVEDLIVAQNGDAILVARKDRAQDIRAIVDAVKKTKPQLA